MACLLATFIVTFTSTKLFQKQNLLPMKKRFTLSLFLLIALQGFFLCGSALAQNVGIGTATPSEKLDVLGNLKFSGALMPNNNAGNSGQLLISQGVGVAPIWRDIDSIADIRTFISNALVQSVPASGPIVYSILSGLTYTITVPAGKNYKAFVSAYGTASKATSTNFDNYAQYEIFLDAIGQGCVERIRIDDELNFFDQAGWAITCTFPMSAGTHTIDVRGAHATNLAPNIYLCNAAGFVGQAVMTIIIIRD
jgi:hypothetical protein